MYIRHIYINRVYLYLYTIYIKYICIYKVYIWVYKELQAQFHHKTSTEQLSSCDRIPYTIFSFNHDKTKINKQNMCVILIYLHTHAYKCIKIYIN